VDKAGEFGTGIQQYCATFYLALSTFQRISANRHPGHMDMTCSQEISALCADSFVDCRPFAAASNATGIAADAAAAGSTF